MKAQKLIVAGLVLAAAPVLSGRAGADEGYDLMRQITSQWVKPNIMLVMDRSGSTAYPVERSEAEWDFDHPVVGDGSPDTGSDWTDRRSNPQYGTGHGYWLRAGLAADGLPGVVRSEFSQNVYVLGNQGWTTGQILTIAGLPTAGDNGVFRISSAPRQSGWNDLYWYFRVQKQRADGSFPTSDYTFTVPSGTSTIFIGAGDADLPTSSIWYFVPPSRMAIMKNALGSAITIYDASVEPDGHDRAGTPYLEFPEHGGPTGGAYYDWAATRWVGWSAGDGHEPIPDPGFTTARAPRDLVTRFGRYVNWGLVSYAGACASFSPDVQINPDDDDQTASLQAIATKLRTEAEGGLVSDGTTPTRGALDGARDALREVFAGDERAECGRTYGAILVTDGQSNQCNPNNAAWSRCPEDWESYPAGNDSVAYETGSNAIWDLQADGTRLNARTWVIGVSQEVGRCELNSTAYRGRTDASSPLGDAGMDTAADPYLPGGSTGWDGGAHGDYAYFTNTADELEDALLTILTALGAGDYATGAPAVSSGGAVAGQVGILASTDYPSWEGHVRAFDLSRAEDDPGYLLWDAATVLTTGSHPTSPSPNNGFARRIYTWNPAAGNELVEVSSTNAATLDTICGGCGITAGVVDFIRGRDGSGTAADGPGAPRPKLLGALMNVTPAVIGKPQVWRRNLLHEHSSFESDFGARHTLIWLGSSDGIVRGFDVVDGAEILALVPPDLLDHQVALHDAYRERPTRRPLGQHQAPYDHRYGVANAVRFADVWFDDLAAYRTVMFLSEGPGGTGLHAVDVTHPYPGRTIGATEYQPDPQYGYGAGADGDPVRVVWSRTADGEAGTTPLAVLGTTWSIPAVAAVEEERWVLQVGTGVRPNPANTVQPRTVFLDPASGDPAGSNLNHSTPSLANAASFYVRNQAFADSVLWSDLAGSYAQDNLANEGVQGDLNGHLWRFAAGAAQYAAEAMVTLSGSDPIYYSPAVASYPSHLSEYALYAWSTGSFFEASPAISGPSIGTGGFFRPRLMITVRDLDDDAVQSVGLNISTLAVASGTTFGSRTQVTAPAMLFTPRSGSDALPFALYLVYDPEGGVCVGRSYIVRVPFDPTDLSLLQGDTSEIGVYLAGEGTASGFAIAGDRVLVAQSGVGEDAEAHLVVVPDLTIPLGGGDANVGSWIELQ